METIECLISVHRKRLYLDTHFIEQVSSGGNNSDLYSGRVGFECRLEHRYSDVVFLIPSSRIPRQLVQAVTSLTCILELLVWSLGRDTNHSEVFFL
jgi:hypothetical protein